MSKTIQRLILFSAPLFVGVVNLFHPVHFESTGIYEAVQQVVGWWIDLHILNLAGFALLGLAMFLLVKDQSGLAASIAKIAIIVFVPAYIAFDALAGIGTGTLILYARDLTPDRLAVLEPTIDAYWASSAVIGLAIIGSVAWNIAMIGSAVTFTEPRRRSGMVILGFFSAVLTGVGYSTSSFGTLPWWIALGVLGLLSLAICRPALAGTWLLLAGVLFGTTHVRPFGPLGMACILLVTLWHEFVVSKAALHPGSSEAAHGVDEKAIRV